MSPVDDALTVAPVFAALGDPTRLALIERLGDGLPLSIARLSEGLGLSRQGVTKHLHVLRDAGVVTSSRVGRETRYAIRPDSVERGRDYLSRASAQWDETLERLRKRVEEGS